MKKMTGIFALICALSCMTGCNSNDIATANAASDNVQITVVTASAATTAPTTATSAVLTTAAATASSGIAQTTAAATVSSAAAKTTAATTVSSAAAKTTAATTVSSAAAKTTAAKAVTTAAQKNTETACTVSGHVWFMVDDIITEYAGKKLDEGIVVFKMFQCSSELMTLPLDVCSKMQKGGQYTIEFNDAKISDPTSFLYVYNGEDGPTQFCDYGRLLTNYGKLGTVRKEKSGEQGLDCDEITWKGLPADAKLKEWAGLNDIKPENFTAEFVDGFFDNPEGDSYDTLVLMRDGKPVLGRTQLDSKDLVPGKRYQFSVTTDDTFWGINAIKPVD